MPATSRSGRSERSSATTPDACRSPEASPATKKTSDTRRGELSGERRSRAFDLSHDPQSDIQRTPSFISRDDYRRFSAEGGSEALELEQERLSFFCAEGDAIYERGHLQRSSWRTGRVDPAFQAEELTGARCQVERDVATVLEDADFPYALPRDSGSRDVCDRTRSKVHARIRYVEHRRENRHANSGKRFGGVVDKRQHEVDVMDHEIKNYCDVGAARIERRQSLTFDESRA